MIAAVLALALVSYLARDLVARKVVEIATERQTGFPLRIGAMHVEPFGGRVEIRDLELMNPFDFPEQRFLSMPLLRVAFEPLSLLRRAPHLAELTVHVEEVFIVTEAKGDKNTARLARSVTTGATKNKEKETPYRVDVLHVRVGKVVVRDFSRGKKTERTLPINLDRTYRNVTSSTNISELVLGSVFESLVPVVGDVAKGLGGVFGGVGREAGTIGKGLLERLRR